MIKDNHISQGYKQTELGVIPEDWKITELGQGLCFQVGFPFPSDHFNSDAVGLRLIRNRDLKCDDQVVYYSGEYKTEYLVRNGDVLIGMDGDFLPCIWRKGPALLNQRVGRIIVRSDWSSGFLFYLLFEPLLHKQEETGATTVKHLSHKDIERMQLPIPPAIEQQKIAESLSDVDALIAALDKKIAKKRLVKQGAMQQLLTGKKRLQGFTDEWVNIEFGHYVDVYRGGSPRPIERFLTSNADGANWIKIGDVLPEDKYINSTTEKIIKEGAQYSREVFAGDFILSNSMSFGRPYILNINGCIHDGWLVIQNYSSAFDIDFLYYTLFRSCNETIHCNGSR